MKPAIYNPASGERQGNFCLSHRNENQEVFYKQTHLPLAALFHNSSVVLKPTKKRKRGGGSQKVLHENSMKENGKLLLITWLKADPELINYVFNFFFRSKQPPLLLEFQLCDLETTKMSQSLESG